MTVYIQHDPADPGLTLPGQIIARSATGMDAVEISLRYDGRTGTRKALMMLARAAVEVVVRARDVREPEPGPLDRYAEGSRWNG